jgi:SAM-dependent methyltransferase
MPVNADDWTPYFDAVKDLPPRDTLLRALDLFDAERTARNESIDPRNRPLAIDLGAGEGRDTLELLRRGWRVIAVDSSPEAARRILDRAPVEHMDRVEIRVQRFQDVSYVPADLINASFSIPHCSPDEFSVLWASIARAIKPGGRFAGQLFGVNDEWARKPDGVTRTYHARAKVESLLADAQLVPEFLDEVERPGKNVFNEPKYWHVFHIVARRSPTR